MRTGSRPCCASSEVPRSYRGRPKTRCRLSVLWGCSGESWPSGWISIVNTYLLSETLAVTPSPVHHEDTKHTRFHEAPLYRRIFVRLRVLRAFVVDRRLEEAGCD